MNKDKLRLWIDALRSGEYMQGKNTLALYDNTVEKMKFCCLGVVCEVAVKDGLDLLVTESFSVVDQKPIRREYGVEREMSFMPQEVVDWLGCDGINVIVKLPEGSASHADVDFVAFLNDGEDWTFGMIANALERTYLMEEQ